MKVRGIQWYYYLIPKENERDKNKALFSVFPRSSCINKFIVCWDHYDEVHKKKSKLYTVFEHYLDFAIYFLKIEASKRSFYEIILGERIQKPHFDIDMDLTDHQIRDGVDKKVLEDLIRVIISLIPQICIETDICIYSSHEVNNMDMDNAKMNKRSYHLIVNRFCHANNKEAKAFYYTVMSKLPKEYFENRWIDHSVYSKTQQFRIYNSKKVASNRVKIFHPIWEFQGKTIVHINNEAREDQVDENLKFLINLEESIVSARPSNCIPLPSFETPNEFVKTKNYEKGEDMEYDLAIEAINLLAHSVGTTPESDNFPFSFDKIEGPFVILKRRKASKCRLCCRTHSHQNPYLLITPDTKNVFFHCRRAPANKNLYIGSLLSEEEKEVSVLKSLEVVIGNPNTVVEDKKNDVLKNNWSANKLEKLKELAASSNPDPSKKTIKKQPKAADPEVVSSIIGKIANERSK